MNKILKITLWILLFLLLTIVGLSFFIFSQTGNNMLKPYVKEKLEEKIGLPVEVNTFKLESGTSSLEIVINKQAFVDVTTQHDLWSQSFEGTYQIKTDRFAYKEIKVKEVDIQGNFKGDSEDIYVEGQGSALGAALDYRFNLIDESAQKIMANMKGAHFSEVLQLAGYPALAEGKLDVEINMPKMAEETASGYGHIVLNKASFDRALVEELYHYTLPEKSYVEGRVDAKLEGKSAQLTGDIQSNLFALQVKDAVMDMATDEANAAYRLDVKDMRILTKNKLAGPFKIEGKLTKKEESTRVTGTSRSLGGVLDFTLGETAKVTLEKLSLEKLLAFLKQPDYAKGELSGDLVLEKLEEMSGTYRLQVDKGVLNPKAVEKMAGYKIPEENTFTFVSKGEIDNALLSGNVKVVSTLTDITLPSFEYDLEQNSLVSEYDLLVHDINALIPQAKKVKATPVSAKGRLTLADTLSISGVTEGLGKKVEFAYDSKTAKVDISELSVEKILALSGLPVYVKGTIDSHIDFTDLDPEEGTFSLKSSKLVTQPGAMKELTGEAFTMNAVVESSGTFKEGKGTIHTKVESSVGNITLDNMVYDAQKQTLKSAYTIDIPNLKDVQPLIGQKLYGPLLLKGELSKDKILQITGATTSLGGKINYTLKGDNLTSTISSVPLENILGTLGHKKNFLGSASGNATYNLKQKSGVVDLDIASFQIKPSDLTNVISLAIGKDPARVIFSSTKFHADIKGNITAYTLHATGTSSSIDITEGRLNKLNNTNTARFKFVYEEHTVRGKIKGSVDHPKITLDTSALIKDKIDEKVQEKLDKALGGKAGEFLKSLPF
ncbi:hypothetical protein [Sulfurovum sp. TSL1]|uniref:hypothetical protein n=1 Tax=Sulfurovum sp. TSL1 TaxID=2826994 RepID=UPI001CC43860|nr:hypothetical protein [Sulfurovum sp. TSL1]GIT98848.1 hypothetical protein TSL1_16690 [Sulfurovum sp. TSL1]